MVIIGGLVLDAARAEDHSHENMVTDYPIDEGANKTDHIRPLQDVVTIDGIVSDTPVNEDPPSAEGNLRSRDAYDRLIELNRTREPVTIVTSLRTYKNMAVESLSFPVDGTTGRALVFGATFKQIEIVLTERALVTVPIARSKSNKGHKPSTPGLTPGSSVATTNPDGTPATFNYTVKSQEELTRTVGQWLKNHPGVSSLITP